MADRPWTDDLRSHLEGFLDDYRDRLRESLDGLSDEEARRSLVPSKTTLLGLVKHVTFVEGFWFDHAVTGRSLKEVGVASSAGRSWNLTKSDTVDAVLEAHREICEASRRNTEALSLDDIVTGRTAQPLGAIYLHVFRELTHHCGHADILREQVLATR